MAHKVAVVCNAETEASITTTLIFASSELALGNEVFIFFCPAGARWVLKGVLEELGIPKGMPDPVKLFNDILELGGEITLCELALENRGIDPKDLRDPRILITKAPPYLMKVDDATHTFVF